jgi:hypothetical protein
MKEEEEVREEEEKEAEKVSLKSMNIKREEREEIHKN